MTRISIEEKFKTVFKMDYHTWLSTHVKEGSSVAQISHLINTKFNIEVQESTVKYHIAQLGLELKAKKEVKKSAKNLLREKGIDYHSLILSLSNLSKEEISEKIEQNYGINVSSSTIYQYARNHNINLPSSKRKKNKEKPQIIPQEEKLKFRGEIKNSDKLIKKLPLLPKRFHPTDQSGFIVFKDIDIIIELRGQISIDSETESKIQLWIKAFKSGLIEETMFIKEIDVSQDRLNTMTEYNYPKICKEICSNEVKDLADLDIYSLRSLLLAKAKNPEGMDVLLDRCKNMDSRSELKI